MKQALTAINFDHINTAILRHDLRSPRPERAIGLQHQRFELGHSH
jgi:hypothetical protein